MLRTTPEKETKRPGACAQMRAGPRPLPYRWENRSAPPLCAKGRRAGRPARAGGRVFAACCFRIRGVGGKTAESKVWMVVEESKLWEGSASCRQAAWGTGKKAGTTFTGRRRAGKAPRRTEAKSFYRLVYRPSVGTSCTYRSSFLHFCDLFRQRIILFWDSGRFCREGRPMRCGKVP